MWKNCGLALSLPIKIKGWCVGWCRGPTRNLQPTPGLFHALLCMCGLDAGEMLVNWLPMYHIITLSSLIENSSGAWISTNLVAARFGRFAFLWFYYSTSILVCRKQALIPRKNSIFLSQTFAVNQKKVNLRGRHWLLGIWSEQRGEGPRHRWRR